MEHPIVTRYLSRVDAALPGYVDGLYLVGSVALDDYQPDRSDIDFVAVVGASVGPAASASLSRVHADLRRDYPRPYFDGIYVTWSDLDRNPVGLSPPFTHESVFHPAGGFEANPSVWLTLHRYPVAVRGPEAPIVWRDNAVIRQWNIDNLNSYWRRYVERCRRPLRRTVLFAAPAAMDETIAWCVPGASRLHYTIRTGDVTSKIGACRYALKTFPPRWHTIIQEALALRQGRPPPHRGRAERLRDLLQFMEFVIEDAQRLPV